MLWFVLAAMTGLTILGALWPLAFRRGERAHGESEADFYRAQLKEIERDVERGQLPPEEAAAARAEAGRRLIAASAAPVAPPVVEGALARRRLAAAAILVLAPAVALGFYLELGRPDLPDAPLAARMVDPSTPAGIALAIAKIESHLTANPDDAQGWQVLAPLYMHLGRFDDAVAAYRQLLRLKGDSGPLLAAYGEALLAAADGVATPDVRAVFGRALQAAPGLPMARFYLALAAEQDGDVDKAKASYQDLAGQANGSQPWMIGLRSRLAALSGAPPPTAPPAKSAASFTPEQEKMIRGMVEGLAARLAESGGSAEEWAKLVRAYSVLQDTEKAKAALADARKAFAKDAPTLALFDTLARELGLGS